jgi:hypothetical protein
MTNPDPGRVKLLQQRNDAPGLSLQPSEANRSTARTSFRLNRKLAHRFELGDWCNFFFDD